MASKWIQFPDVTLTNGSKIVSVNNGADTSGVLAGYALLVGSEFLEIESKTSNSISLVNTYPGATQSNVAAQVMQTHASLEESLLAALQRLNTNADTFDQVKSAALRDVQASPMDTTPGRVLIKGSWGIGTESTPEITDFNDAVEAGFYRAASTANNPAGLGTAFGTLLVESFSTSGTTQTFVQATPTLTVYKRGRVAGEWQSWQPVYTGANLNPSVFNGNSSEFLASDGYGRTASTANIYFPLLSNSKPTSITVVGSFTVDTVDFVSRGTVTSADMALQGISTGKIARVDISGLSGVVTSEPLILRAASAGSSITFNF